MFVKLGNKFLMLACFQAAPGIEMRFARFNLSRVLFHGRSMRRHKTTLKK